MSKLKELKKEMLIVKKPNQTIMISSHGNITGTQRKAYNVLLHKALDDLRVDNDKTSFLIPIHIVKERAGIEATDNLRLKEDLKKLMDIKIEVVKEKNNWAVFNLLSSVEKEGDLLRFDFPRLIREALIKNDYYTALDLMIIKTFKCKYAVILYEIAMRYHKVEIPLFTIEEFKKLTGTENYTDFKDLRKKVIDPALIEINENSDKIMYYQPVTQGRKVTGIKFYVTDKPQIVFNPEPKPEPKQVNTELLNFLLSFGISKSKADALMVAYPESYIKEVLTYVQNKIDSGKVKDIPAFTISALEKDYRSEVKLPQQQQITIEQKIQADIAAREAEMKAREIEIAKEKAILKEEQRIKEAIQAMPEADRLKLEKQADKNVTKKIGKLSDDADIFQKKSRKAYITSEMMKIYAKL